MANGKGNGDPQPIHQISNATGSTPSCYTSSYKTDHFKTRQSRKRTLQITSDGETYDHPESRPSAGWADLDPVDSPAGGNLAESNPVVVDRTAGAVLAAVLLFQFLVIVY